ncbi:unnamed protein product, partial [Mesorhabditis belari]|uniref:Guanylate-binding protein N-terminal domain-containing protein n=1 Tax=Mesorhabditis belari TaxID=2138241 RepID=A0AAF3ENR9_9BILA
MVFHEDVARKTILNEKFSNFKKSIVSIMGPSRMGKSFFLLYLNKEAESEEIRGAFQSGHSRCTAGILISTQPYQLANDQLIFFLDTQGTFDLETDRKVSVWIASFSLHFSDIQIVNLRGNIGGNDLQDLYTFVQFAMTYPGARLPKQLIFLIRDAPQIDQDNIFLENLQMQCSNSVELKEIMDFLRKKFEISVFCLPTVSENIRKASGFVVMEDSVDSAFYQKMNVVKESIGSVCKNNYNKLPEDLIDFGHKICAHITTVAPQLGSTVEIIKQVSKAKAVNKSFDFFLNLIKTLKAENFADREIKIENETINHLLSFNLKPEDLEEAKATLMQRMNEKLEELKAQWMRDLDEKEEKEAISDFLRKERTRINKIHEIKELLENCSIESAVKEFSKTLSKELTREAKQELSQKVTNMVMDRLSYLKASNLPKILDDYRVIHGDKLENHFIRFDKVPDSHVLEGIKLETEDELKAELRSLQFKIDEEAIILQRFEEKLQTSTSTFLQHKQTILDQRNNFEKLKRQQVEVFDNGGEESRAFDAAEREFLAQSIDCSTFGQKYFNVSCSIKPTRNSAKESQASGRGFGESEGSGRGYGDFYLDASAVDDPRENHKVVEFD